MTTQDRSEALPSYGFEIKDPQRFVSNMVRLVAEGGKAVAACIQPQADTFAPLTLSDDVAPVVSAFAQMQQA